jgi:glyoxylate reductase
VLSEDVADFAWALLLGCARRVGECDAYARSGDFTKYLNMVLLGTKVTGKTIGIVGMGRIGLEIGKRARGFGMKILYHNRTRKPEAEAVLGGMVAGVSTDCVYVDKLYDMLAEADFVVLICPLTGATRHLIDAEALGHFKKGSILINIARGGVVDTAALTDALTSADRLAAAGLDVTEPEPLPRDHPLLSLRNVILAPHRGSGTVETRAAMTDLSTKNLLLGLAGDDLHTPCNIDIQRKGGGGGEGKE